MVRNNRSKFIALGLVAVLFLLPFCFWAALSITKYQTEHAQKRESVSAYQAETVDQYPEVCLKDGVSAIIFFKCIIKTVDANRNSQRSQYDLEAQQEMAEWAYGLLLLTLVGLFLSAIGVSALFYSLYQTRTVIRDTREIGEAQVRAYIGCERADYSLQNTTTGFKGKIAIEIKNFGQTPAYNINLSVGLRLSARASPVFPKISTAKVESEFARQDNLLCPILSPETKHNFVARFDSHNFEDKWIKKLFKGECDVEISSILHWVDVFDQKEFIQISGTDQSPYVPTSNHLSSLLSGGFDVITMRLDDYNRPAIEWNRLKELVERRKHFRNSRLGRVIKAIRDLWK